MKHSEKKRPQGRETANNKEKETITEGQGKKEEKDEEEELGGGRTEENIKERIYEWELSVSFVTGLKDMCWWAAAEGREGE